MSTLVYQAPPPDPKEEMIRRVYVLPRDLVERIFAHGYATKAPSEIAAVRDLLEHALNAAESLRSSSITERSK